MFRERCLLFGIQKENDDDNRMDSSFIGGKNLIEGGGSA